VLDPLLFLINIIDHAQELHCPHYMFADEVKIVGNPNEQALQEDLDRLMRWTLTWKLPLNVAKCQLLSNAEGGLAYRLMKTDVGGVPVDRVRETRDLVIKVTSDFKPSKQCVEAARRGHWALTRLRRTVASRNPGVLLPLYKSFVRPYLEYAVQAWAPYLKKDALAIERVQRRFTRIFPGLRDMSYGARLKKLNLFSMERRRLRGDLIETFRILKGISDLGENSMFDMNLDTRLRGHSLKLAKTRARLLVRHNYFSNRVVNNWNKLPEDVVRTNNVIDFKRKLDNCWSTVFPNSV
jgi:ribonuclease P/MRP protein subunit RPP40